MNGCGGRGTVCVGGGGEREKGGGGKGGGMFYRWVGRVDSRHVLPICSEVGPGCQVAAPAHIMCR
jgi:hypothetical protein